MNPARLLGIAGTSGSGKTTLLTRLIPLLTARGLRVATVKHAHHGFDVDSPGKDSHAHRAAGAGEVLVVSARRWVLMHENDLAPEPPLPELLRRLSPCDLILIEGFKREPYPRIEVFRPENGKEPLYPQDPWIVAVATPAVLPAPHPRRLDLRDVTAIADAVLEFAEPMHLTTQRLEGASPGGWLRSSRMRFRS
jgi:molybdopterin-guanine dinucleotide biosynthesis adapter protein